MIGICDECKRPREVMRTWRGVLCGHCERTKKMKQRHGFTKTIYRPKGDKTGKERL